MALLTSELRIPDHPRARGRDLHPRRFWVHLPGPPARARKRRVKWCCVGGEIRDHPRAQIVRDGKQILRTTRARAEETNRQPAVPPTCSDHPRARGRDVTKAAFSLLLNGPPARARKRRHPVGIRTKARRTTRARAEETR